MSSGPSMVFHVPHPVEAVPKVGSGTHVTRMLEGFRAAGFEVEIVSGYSRERARDIRRVRAAVKAGRRFDFVYSEATTTPTALNDEHHLPVRPLMDFRFLSFMRRHGVPIGLFYPDIHWRFDFYRDIVPFHKRLTALLFYRFDLWWYHKVLDVFFLPSERMALTVPGWESSSRVKPLFPGGRPDPLRRCPRSAGELHLFYVGSVAPPLYDISGLVAAVDAVPGVHLTVCCPANQRALVPDSGGASRVTVVHEHGDALRSHYERCDVACLVYPPTEYRQFAMPVKLFEAVGHGRPVIVSGGAAVAEFVSATNVGWLVDPPPLEMLLRTLRDDPSKLDERHELVLAAHTDHSWTNRAEYVAATLAAEPRSSPGDAGQR